MAKVVWPSRETYALLPVVKNEPTREPGTFATAAPIAAGIPVSFVTSPFEVKTAISGACSPVPNVFSARWFASYAA